MCLLYSHDTCTSYVLKFVRTNLLRRTDPNCVFSVIRAERPLIILINIYKTPPHSARSKFPARLAKMKSTRSSISHLSFSCFFFSTCVYTSRYTLTNASFARSRWGLPFNCTLSLSLWQVINRSARYRNRYVHRRDSLSLANITLEEKEKLAKIGKKRRPVI